MSFVLVVVPFSLIVNSARRSVKEAEAISFEAFDVTLVFLTVFVEDGRESIFRGEAEDRRRGRGRKKREE